MNLVAGAGFGYESVAIAYGSNVHNPTPPSIKG